MEGFIDLVESDLVHFQSEQINIIEHVHDITRIKSTKLLCSMYKNATIAISPGEIHLTS